MAKKYWTGSIKQRDDFDFEITDTFYDAKTAMGPWAIMSPGAFRAYGLGRTGLGIGQKYEKQSDGRWLKTEG